MYEELYQRNIGIFTKDQQYKIKNLTVAVAGLGGVGGILAERLARLGVGNLNIADPESFEPNNRNRQIFSNTETNGKNKALVFEKELKKINPDINLRVWTEGVTKTNVSDFVNADIVTDCIEYNLLEHSLLLHNAARKAQRIVLAGQAIGHGATLFAFDPNGLTFEEYIGLPKESSTTEIRSFITPTEKFCPTIPEYVPSEIVKKVANREMHIPSNSLGVMTAASLIEITIINLCLDLKKIPFVPDYLSIDFYSDLQ